MIIDGLVYLFQDMVLGSPLLFAVITLLIIFIIHIIAKTSINSIMPFMILPVYSLNKAGILNGFISGSIFALLILINAFLLFKVLSKFIGDR